MTWIINGLQTGAVMFGGGLTLLYLNPFWHFDDRGFLDWRVHWWNTTAEWLVGVGSVISALSFIAIVAALGSRFSKNKSWPYAAGLLLVVSVVMWTAPFGLVRNLQAHFEWNAADGFSVFQLHPMDDEPNSLRATDGSALQSFVAIQIEPLLRGYFKLNDWQKMDGDVDLRLARILPFVLPVSVEGEDLTLEDPDETPLMRACAGSDIAAVQQLLSQPENSVNALDQGGDSALILACQNPRIKTDIVKALLARGANVNLRSRNGYTALTWAQARKNSEVIRILRRAGARP